MTTTAVTDRSALGAALRELKLSGMLDTLDARLTQARAGELGHLDFLQVLCQDEISRRETTSLTRRIRAARFETEATLEGFNFAASPKLPAAQIRDLAALRWLQSGELEHPGFGGDSILPRCSGLGGRCLPRYRRLAEPQSDHFSAFVYRTSVQLRCSAAPPGGGLRPPGPPRGAWASPRRAPRIAPRVPRAGQG